jgi:hypothetical protein
MNSWIVPFRLFGYAVVVLVVLAICYAAYISVTYWSGIRV